jgi:sodium/bile acid cotransporter 7
MAEKLTALRALGRRWFLVALLTGLLVAWRQPTWLAWTRALDPRWVVTTALFCMALGLPSRRLGQAIIYPWPALWAVTLSYTLLPLCALRAGAVLPVADFGVGLFLSCTVPCTLASAVLWTRLARGDEATAMLAVILSTASSWLITTAWLTFAGVSALGLEDMTAMMTDLVVSLVFPVGVGQLARTWSPVARAASRGRAVLGVVAQLLILTILLKAAAVVGDRLQQESGSLTPLSVAGVLAVCVLVHLIGLTVGLVSSRWLRFPRPAQVAVAFASSQKTLPVALLLFERYFQEYPLAVVALASYHFGQLLMDTFVADWLARAYVSGAPASVE